MSPNYHYKRDYYISLINLLTLFFSYCVWAVYVVRLLMFTVVCEQRTSV